MAKNNYLRHCVDGIHVPVELRTYPGKQIHPGAPQVGVQVDTSNLVQVRWQPSFPHAEYIWLAPEQVLGAENTF